MILPPAYLIFAQTTDPHADVAGWNAHARRFFATDLRHLHDDPPDRGPRAREMRERLHAQPSDLPPFRVEIVAAGAPPAIRSVSSRLRVDADLARADAADAGGSGLARLARRCPRVWLIGREEDDDPAALLLAAILASVFLGPILDERGPELLGVKSARARLGQ